MDDRAPLTIDEAGCEQMRIVEVEAFALHASGSQGNYGAPYGAIVRVATDSGIVGWGETDSCPSVVKAIIEAPYHHELMSGLRSLLLGQDSLDIAALWRRMHRGTSGYGRDGVVVHAMAAVDLALWDIKGKSLRRPVYELLGGARRHKVRVYGTHALGRTLTESAAHAARLRDRGFSAVKFGWSPLGPDPAADEAIVRTLRTAIGASVDLLIDGGNAWDVAAALERCRRFAPYNVFWLEEPLQPDDFAGYAQLTAAAGLCIAAGEQASTIAELERLATVGRVHVLQVDVSRVGLTQAMQVAAIAGCRGIPCVNHTYSLDVNLAASLHFMAAIPNTSLFEYPAMANEIREHLFRNRPVPVDGLLAVPEAPGLGMDIDIGALERFAVRA
jgi:L-alanine-DL-glutamate epimerase-like enolase superfamily enzyme